MNAKRYRYLIPLACFRCRKALKRPWFVREQQRAAWLSYRRSGRLPAKPFATPDFLCPACGAPMTLLPRAFQVPRRDDLDAWRKVEWSTGAGTASGRIVEAGTSAAATSCDTANAGAVARPAQTRGRGGRSA
jgi:hypothetical protein